MDNKNISLLLISDDPADTELLKSKFSPETGSSLKITFVPNLSEGLLKFSTSSFDVVILSFESSRSIEAMNNLHELRGLLPYTPIIIFSDSSDPNLIVELIQGGAQEYLVKTQVGEQDILKKIHRAVERQHLLTDKNVVIGQTFTQARRDPLTGLPNRQLFRDRLKLGISEMKKINRALGVLFIDLDHFKEINDRFGHDTGDQVLKIIASRLQHSLKRYDTVGRMGGDEFVILAQNLRSPEEASQIADRMVKTIERPLRYNTLLLNISASIGISLCPQHGFDPETLLKNADIAMYHVKSQGGHNFKVFQNVVSNFSKDKTPRQSPSPGLQTVLIVEDDKDMRSYIQQSLSKQGYTCLNASSVEEAIQSLEQSMPQLILLDLGFQEASGFTLMQYLIDEDKKGKEIPPILIMSGHTDPEMIALTKQMGASRFISKPFDPALLLAEVRSLIH